VLTFGGGTFAAKSFQAVTFGGAAVVDDRPLVLQPVVWAEVWHGGPAWSEVSLDAEQFAEVTDRAPVFVEINGVFIMLAPKVIETEFVVGRGCTIRALLTDGPPQSVGSVGEPITSDDVDEVLLTVTSDGDVVSGYDELSLTVADVILDELQGVGDPRVDGANLVVDIPAAAFPDPDVMATVVIAVASVDGSKSWLVEARGRVRAAGG